MPPPGCGGYCVFRGFEADLAAQLGAAASGSVLRIVHWGDNSLFENIAAGYINPQSYTTTTPHAAVVYDVCCNATVRNLTAEGQDGPTNSNYGTQPLVIGDASNTYTTYDAVFDRLNPNHPGRGLNALQILGSKTSQVHITSIYTEGGFNAAGEAVPIVYIGSGAQGVNIDSMSARFYSVGSTQWMIQIAGGSSNVTFENLYSDSTGNCINDLNSGVTVLHESGANTCFAAAYTDIGKVFSHPLMGALAEDQSAPGNTSAAVPSFNLNFFGGWWNRSNGAARNAMGAIYAVPTANNQSSIPMGRMTVQVAPPGGAPADSFSVFGNGHVAFGSSPDVDCGSTLCVNGRGGFTGTKKAGSCVFTIQSGLITAVSGC